MLKVMVGMAEGVRRQMYIEMEVDAADSHTSRWAGRASLYLCSSGSQAQCLFMKMLSAVGFESAVRHCELQGRAVLESELPSQLDP